MANKHDPHYLDMNIQPYEVFRSMGILKEYLAAAAVKYIMRAGLKNADDPIASALEDIDKAISVLEDLQTEIRKKQEVPF